MWSVMRQIYASMLGELRFLDLALCLIHCCSLIWEFLEQSIMAWYIEPLLSTLYSTPFQPWREPASLDGQCEHDSWSFAPPIVNMCSKSLFASQSVQLRLDCSNVPRWLGTKRTRHQQSTPFYTDYEKIKNLWPEQHAGQVTCFFSVILFNKIPKGAKKLIL